MILSRPFFPPVAEFVQAFPHQPATRQSESQSLTSESAKPVKGLSRRLMLAGLAAVGIPTSARAAATEPDPIFALIAAKRSAEAAYSASLRLLGEAEDRYGVGSPEEVAVWNECEGPCHAARDAAWSLASTQPTTLAGVAAVLRFANQFEDEGNEWPCTDTIGAEGWHYQLRATMAQAIEAIIRKGAV